MQKHLQKILVVAFLIVATIFSYNLGLYNKTLKKISLNRKRNYKIL